MHRCGGKGSRCWYGANARVQIVVCTALMELSAPADATPQGLSTIAGTGLGCQQERRPALRLLQARSVLVWPSSCDAGLFEACGTPGAGRRVSRLRAGRARARRRDVEEELQADGQQKSPVVSPSSCV